MKKFLGLGLILLSFSIIFADNSSWDRVVEDQRYIIEVDDGDVVDEVDNCPMAKTKAKQYLKKGHKKVKISARYGATARSGCRGNVYTSVGQID